MEITTPLMETLKIWRNDGFFEMIGLDKMFQTEKEPKKPQDHKKKIKRKSYSNL